MSPSISVTVAAIVQREGRFLLVEEQTDEGVRINQPAGHLEPGESLAAGAAREALEETAWHFMPTWLLGVYRWQHPLSGVTYVRFAFGGEVDRHEPQRGLDEGILRAVWLTPAELKAQSPRHRSPLVQRCVEDCLAGRRFPLDLIVDVRGST
jgi:8-oxo-dGTP pyrophosphatase MutT (NUDIX family)